MKVKTHAPKTTPLPQRVSSLEEGRVHLENRILAHLPRGKLVLALTDNHHTMVSVRKDKGGYRVRVHHMFLFADSRVIRALARYIATNDRHASHIIGSFIEEHKEFIRSKAHRRPTPKHIQPKGTVHDLQAIFDDLNSRFFGGLIQASITWGRRHRGHPKRHTSIKMGSYSVEDRLIRIHPSLDRPFVPRYFVEWIVYHEMLHQIFEIRTVRGRRRFHPRWFKKAEALFPDHDRAVQWEKEHLSALLMF